VSANKARSNLKTFFNWAISEGHCDVNPVENTNVNHTESRSHVLEPRELRAIWQHLPDDCYGKVSRLLVLTGFRLNEAAGLVRSEINFEDKQIELPKERTKNSKPFIMPLSPFALSLIPTDKNDLLFPNPIGKKYTRAARKITRFAEFVRV